MIVCDCVCGVCRDTGDVHLPRLPERKGLPGFTLHLPVLAARIPDYAQTMALICTSPVKLCLIATNCQAARAQPSIQAHDSTHLSTMSRGRAEAAVGESRPLPGVSRPPEAPPPGEWPGLSPGGGGTTCSRPDGERAEPDRAISIVAGMMRPCGRRTAAQWSF